MAGITNVPTDPKTKGERLGLRLYSQLTIGATVRDNERQLILETIQYMLGLEVRDDKAARQAGELLDMSRKLTELYDS